MRFSLKLGAPSPEPWMSGSRQILGVSPKFLELSAANLTFLLQRKGSRKNRSGGERSPTSLRPKGVTRAGEWSGTICTLCQSDLAEKKNAFLSIYRWFLYTNQAFPRTVEKIFPKLATQLLKSAFFVGLRWVPIYFQQILAWPTSISVAWTNARYILFQPCRSFQDSHLYFNPLLTST